MPRYGRHRSNPRRRAVALVLLLALAGWSIWQMAAVRQSILADMKKEDGGAEVVETPATAPDGESERQVVLQGDGPRTAWGEEIPDQPEIVVEPAPLSAEALAARAAEAALLLASAESQLESGALVDARDDLNAALSLMDAASAQAHAVRERLASMNTGVFMGPEVLVDDPYAPLVDIAPGDSFQRLGRKHRIPTELVAMMNPQLTPTNLKIGSGVKVVHGPFHLHVIKSAGRADLYARDMYVRSFAVEVEEGMLLARGTYRVRPGGKVHTTRDGGACWIALQGFGKSGPGADEAWMYGSGGVRGDADSGVRMSDADLRALYNVLVEQDSLVRVD